MVALLNKTARGALLATLLILPLVLSSCGGNGTPAGGLVASIAEARSDKERITEPDVSAGELDELVSGNSTFAFDLYRALRDPDGNLFFSPYSISAALAMTYAGARGETEQEMAETLSFILAQEKLHAAFNALDLELAEQQEPIGDEDGEAFQLSIANSVWGQKDFEFLAPFLDTLAEHYGAGLRLLDFVNEAEEARETINAWVSDQTEERIPELLPEGTIDALTRLVLTNAIYFNASWSFPFPEENTREGAFHLLDGTEVQAPMMRLDEMLRYGEVGGVQAARLPYTGGEFSAYVLVPAEGEFESFESSLDAATLDAIIAGLGERQVALTMPKFEFESSFDLNDTLIELGMPSAFDLGRADFSGMDGKRDLFISDVIHKSFVSVDEAGTEAAAATAVVMRLTASPERAELAVDRPFLFLIRHDPTGTILFAGRVLDPTV
jgi:serpin B